MGNARKTPKDQASAVDKRDRTADVDGETTSERVAGLRAIRDLYQGNESPTQRTKCLAAFQQFGTLSTVEARRHLDVMHPAARIKELNDAGLVQTVTLRRVEQTECGRLHHVGLYVVVRDAAPVSRA